MNEADMRSHMRVCSRHFPDRDASEPSNMYLGKRFSSPVKKGPRAKRAKQRKEYRQSLTSSTSSFALSAAPTSSHAEQHPLLTTAVGELIESDYTVHELPSECTPQTDPLIHASLVARIEYLEGKIEPLEKDKRQVMLISKLSKYSTMMTWRAILLHGFIYFWHSMTFVGEASCQSAQLLGF